MRIKGPFVDLYRSKYFLSFVLLLGFTIVSGLAVVYCKHRNRMLHVKLQQIYTMRSELNGEWSKLLLEKSTWVADHRVEHLAKYKLNMATPEQIHIIR